MEAEIVRFPTKRKRAYDSMPFHKAVEPGDNVIRLERPPVWILVRPHVASVLRSQGHAL